VASLLLLVRTADVDRLRKPRGELGFDWMRPSRVRQSLYCSRAVLLVYNRIKLQVDLQADKSPVVVKGPFFPRVVNPRYRIRGTNV
jgi:hypothetical protein